VFALNLFKRKRIQSLYALFGDYDLRLELDTFATFFSDQALNANRHISFKVPAMRKFKIRV
jgi:hypothetical protein